MFALRMPTVKQDPEKQPTEVVGRSCYAGEEDMKVSSPKLNNLILANLPVGRFESETRQQEACRAGSVRVEH